MEILERKIRELGSLSDAAVALGVTVAYLYMLIKGQRSPSRKLLNKLGLKRVERVVRA